METLTSVEKLIAIYFSKINSFIATNNSGSPLDARQPRLGPWLDFEKYKTAAAAAMAARR